MMRRALLVTASLSITACVTTQNDYQYYFQRKGITSYNKEVFQHCHGYGCKHISEVTLSKKDWTGIEKLFSPEPRDAEDERRKISVAIAAFENAAGHIIGTEEDQYGTFRNSGRFQQDCVDESTNTTIYLVVLKEKGLLKYHDIRSPTVRLPLLHAGRWPHQTAVITETATGQSYAVDSWFHDNGFPAEIVPLEEWKDGWKPEMHKRHGDSAHKG